MTTQQRLSKFEQGVAQHSGSLRAFLRSRLASDDEAEDALQEILYNLFRTAGDDLESIANLPAWLYRSARNLLTNLGRRHCAASSEEYDMLLEIIADNRYSADSRLLRDLFWRELEKALGNLPNEQREVWELAELTGLSTKEIAARTGVSTATVLSRKHYAVKHLRRKLRRLYDDIIST